MDFPLSLSDMSLWLGVTAVMLLIASELISLYYRKGTTFINKKRLRNVAVAVSTLFLTTIAIRMFTMLSP